MFLLIYEEKYGGVVLSCKVQKIFATFYILRDLQ